MEQRKHIWAMLLLIATCLFSNNAFAYEAEINGIYYYFNGDKAIVTYRSTSYNSYTGDVVIPESVVYNAKTYSVTSIGGRAFERCSGLTSVTIPNSVTSIGDRAFGGCSYLKKVIVPDIAAWCGIAFEGYNSNPLYYAKHLYSNETTEITNLIIPNSVTSIGESAFRNCSGLTSITIPNSVTSIEDYAFSYCSGLTSVTIPNSVRSIGDRAFEDCSGLTSVTIPNSVTSIGNEAFRGCTGLTTINVEAGNTVYDSRNNCNAIIETATNTLITGCKNTTIPNSVTSIGSYAFYNCSGLTSVTIRNSVTSIGNSAFYGCHFAKESFINNSTLTSNTYWGATIYDIETDDGLLITDNIVIKCRPWATSVTIPNSVTSIGDRAFERCLRLTSVTIGNSVTSIGNSAFSGCSGLTSVNIPNSVTSIGSDAFLGCKGLTTINVEAGNTVYDSRNNCNAIIETATNTLITGCKNTIIPNSVTSIGTRAFYNCSGLTSVNIPNSVTSIEVQAFSYCSGLTSVNIPNSVISIGSSAFLDCTGLTAVTLNSNAIASKSYSSDSSLGNVFGQQVNTYIMGEDVTSIGDYAFYNCSGLTSITIPNSVTSIGESAFRNCSGLTTINVEVGNIVYDSRNNCNAIIETATNTLIQGCKNTTIPNSVTSIGSDAFFGCSGLTSVNIPNSVTSIGSDAFNNCSGLTSVNIPNSVTSIGKYAFYGCSGLTSVNIPNSVTYIGVYAFNGCTGLTAVTLNSNAIASKSYSSSSTLGKVFGQQVNTYVIGEDVTSIGDYAFYNCSGLTSINIGNSVTSIGESAFRNCSGLTPVTIPNSVRSIGDYVFSGCKLRNVLIKCATPPAGAKTAFSNQTLYHTTLYVPTGCWDAYAYDDDWYLFHNIRETATTEEQVAMQQAYTLMDAETFTYSVYDPVNNCIGTIKSVSAIDENNPNHSWQVITDGNKQYLYNLGAKKFATNGADGRLVLTAEPTPIDMENGDNGIVLGSQAAHQWALVGNDRLSVEQDIITGIDEIASTRQGESTSYDLQGRQIGKPQEGINIIRNADGTTKKVLIKH